jgi:hypothetical protein
VFWFSKESLSCVVLTSYTILSFRSFIQKQLCVYSVYW